MLARGRGWQALLELPDAPDGDQQAEAESAAEQHVGFHFMPLKARQRRCGHQRASSKVGDVSSAPSGRAIRRVREYYASQLSERMRDRWLCAIS
ncbi:hypothetical protein Bcep18194_B1366 [Burkholderia lata]|uniref:Uncharacterized protein n=1 Tax=Burkholderia lata (strain ATCC 17760 / DSM 23089 / LMG 22485 / NCIMB 9086 / R18194 / 383) TaxID=482957 RepID=Q396Y1_BURL3|nr:hypothetical protein Bcep18194_B1366 [Burkholderia lata]